MESCRESIGSQRCPIMRSNWPTCITEEVLAKGQLGQSSQTSVPSQRDKKPWTSSCNLFGGKPIAEIFYCLVPFLQNSLVIDTPRVRKQTRPFSATKDELAELSEGESDSDETKPKLRRNYDRLNSYGRTECFRVEKNLLVYG